MGSGLLIRVQLRTQNVGAMPLKTILRQYLDRRNYSCLPECGKTKFMIDKILYLTVRCQLRQIYHATLSDKRDFLDQVIVVVDPKMPSKDTKKKSVNT